MDKQDLDDLLGVIERSDISFMIGYLIALDHVFDRNDEMIIKCFKHRVYTRYAKALDDEKERARRLLDN